MAKMVSLKRSASERKADRDRLGAAYPSDDDEGITVHLDDAGKDDIRESLKASYEGAEKRAAEKAALTKARKGKE